MKAIVYLEVRPEESHVCKNFAYINGNKNNGHKFYFVDLFDGFSSLDGAIYSGCTCKAVIVSLTDEEKNILPSNVIDEINLKNEEEEGKAEKIKKRHERASTLFNKINIKFASGNEKPTILNGWKEIINPANIDTLNLVTKNARIKKYEELP